MHKFSLNFILFYCKMHFIIWAQLLQKFKKHTWEFLSGYLFKNV
jgi:hypothetical protein